MTDLCGVCGAYWECSCVRPLTEEEASVIICAAESEAGYKEAMRLVESRADTLTDSDYANAIVAQHDYMLGLLTGEANT